MKSGDFQRLSITADRTAHIEGAAKKLTALQDVLSIFHLPNMDNPTLLHTPFRKSEAAGWECIPNSISLNLIWGNEKKKNKKKHQPKKTKPIAVGGVG